jgi:hypothetical protein
MQHIVAAAPAQMCRCVSNYHPDGVVHYGMLNRKTVAVGTTIARSTKIYAEDIAKLVREARILRRTGLTDGNGVASRNLDRIEFDLLRLRRFVAGDP